MPCTWLLHIYITCVDFLEHPSRATQTGPCKPCHKYNLCWICGTFLLTQHPSIDAPCLAQSSAEGCHDRNASGCTCSIQTPSWHGWKSAVSGACTCPPIRSASCPKAPEETCKAKCTEEREHVFHHNPPIRCTFSSNKAPKCQDARGSGPACRHPVKA